MRKKRACSRKGSSRVRRRRSAQLSDDDLLQGLTGHVTPDRLPIDMWLEYEGIYPGTTRVLSSELHRLYTVWHRNLNKDGKLHALAQFGMLLTARFKAGHSRKGTHYYISRDSENIFRERVLDIVPLVKVGGRGNPGGSTPGTAAKDPQQDPQKSKKPNDSGQ